MLYAYFVLPYIHNKLFLCFFFKTKKYLTPSYSTIDYVMNCKILFIIYMVVSYDLLSVGLIHCSILLQSNWHKTILENDNAR